MCRRSLAASACSCLPSRWEGMPNVMLEAMATALPIVAVRTHGVEELLGPLAESQSVSWAIERASLPSWFALGKTPRKPPNWDVETVNGSSSTSHCRPWWRHMNIFTFH